MNGFNDPATQADDDGAGWSWWDWMGFWIVIGCLVVAAIVAAVLFRLFPAL